MEGKKKVKEKANRQAKKKSGNKLGMAFVYLENILLYRLF